MNKFIFSFLFVVFSIITTFSQRQLTLGDVVTIAREKSVAAKRAETAQQINYWRFKIFKAGLLPQLAIDGTFPRFTRAVRGITQEDGSIVYRPLDQNRMDVELTFSQRIPQTGGNIYVSTSLDRFDDFNKDQITYGGDPVSIGFVQPLFSFNSVKWEKRIEPLVLEESKREFVEEMEQISSVASAFFFDLLTAQISLGIAQANVQSNDTIYQIAQGRYQLGKIPENELLQLELNLMNSRQAVARAELDLETSQLILRSFLGLNPNEELQLIPPSEIPEFYVDDRIALTMAWQHRSEAIGFERRLLEAEMTVENSVKESGLNASLFGRFGLSNQGAFVGDIYNKPDQQVVANVGFQIPIMDWGRQKAIKTMADLNYQLTSYAVQTDTTNFTQEVFTQVKSFDMLRGQVEIAAKADEISQKRYEISKNRYMIGKIEISDLSRALEEKDRAKQDYLSSLGDFWAAYYRLRALTLYDFERQSPLYTESN